MGSDSLRSGADALGSGNDVGRDVPRDTGYSEPPDVLGREAACYERDSSTSRAEPERDREALRSVGAGGTHHPHQTLAEVRRAHGRGPTGPYAGARKELNYQRRCQRYALLRNIGVPYCIAHKASYSAAGFAREYTAAGGDVSLYAELAQKLPSGPPRSNDKRSVERTERYADLKRRGLTPVQATKYSAGGGLYQKALRHLEKGIPL
jgi:hypothetical protein